MVGIFLFFKFWARWARITIKGNTALYLHIWWLLVVDQTFAIEALNSYDCHLSLCEHRVINKTNSPLLFSIEELKICGKTAQTL